MYPVYKIVHYDGTGGHNCLDALGGSGAVGSVVAVYGCDPNAVNQPNQLWVVGNDTDTVPTTWYGLHASSTLTPDNADFGGSGESLIIQNLASLAANNWITKRAPILSMSEAPTLTKSLPKGVTLQVARYPTTTGNSAWSVRPPITPQPSP